MFVCMHVWMVGWVVVPSYRLMYRFVDGCTDVLSVGSLVLVPWSRLSAEAKSSFCLNDVCQLLATTFNQAHQRRRIRHASANQSDAQPGESAVAPFFVNSSRKRKKGSEGGLPGMCAWSTRHGDKPEKSWETVAGQEQSSRFA